VSLESAISDLVNSTNTLNTNVQNTLSTVNSQISALNSKIVPYNTTIQVGPGKQFTDLQSALNYATSSVLPIGSIINIQLSDGNYDISGIPSNGYFITINGNSSDPTKVILNSGIIGLGNIKVIFSNLTIVDTYCGANTLLFITNENVDLYLIM